MFYRTGGTENWKWHVTLVARGDQPAQSVVIRGMGYPTFIGEAIPTEREPAGMRPSAPELLRDVPPYSDDDGRRRRRSQRVCQTQND